jgi:hypothetical protein
MRTVFLGVGKIPGAGWENEPCSLSTMAAYQALPVGQINVSSQEEDEIEKEVEKRVQLEIAKRVKVFAC